MSLQLKLYSDFAPVPSRILALVKLLIKKKRLPRKHAFNYVHPIFVDPEADTIQTLRMLNESEQFKEVTRAALECGLIMSEGLNGELFIDPNIDDTLLHPKSIDEAFPFVMAKLALQPTINGEKNLFPEICAWILNQSVMDPPQDKGAWKSLLDKQNPSLYVEAGLNNDATWDMIVYWMIYLGFAGRTEHTEIQGFYPDPTVYIQSHIKSLLTIDDIHIKEFTNRLGKVCPIIDGGSMFEIMNFNNRPDDLLSDSLSFAIERLSYRKVIKFHCPNDPRDFCRLFNDKKIAFISLNQGH